MKNTTLSRKYTLFIIATVLIVGTSSTFIPASFAQPYYQPEYRDTYSKDKNHLPNVIIQKNNCINTNINIQGVEITTLPIPADTLTSQLQNSGQAGTEDTSDNFHDKENNANNNGKNLVNICKITNLNGQISSNPPDGTEGCEECFTNNLDEQQIDAVEAVLAQLSENPDASIEDLCESILNSGVPNEAIVLGIEGILELANIPSEEIETILECLNDLGIIEYPIEQSP